MRLQGKTALVTGSSSGIGRAIATRFALEGADIVINGRDEKKIAGVVKEIEATGRRALGIRANVGSFTESKAISLSLWDHQQKNTLRIDLWTKEMPVNEMKRFYIDCLGGLAQSVLTSTGDENMSGEINSLCERLAVQVRKSE